MPPGRLVSLLLNNTCIDRIKIDLHPSAVFIRAVNFVARSWLFEFLDLVTKIKHLLFEALLRHPLIPRLIGTVLFGLCRKSCKKNDACQNNVFHKPSPLFFIPVRGLSPRVTQASPPDLHLPIGQTT